MSREAIAQALDKAAEALAEAAHAMRATEPDRSGSVAATVPSGAPAAAGVPPTPAASINTGECPKHRVAWESGTYGPYCKQMTDDPAWGKPKTDRDGKPVLWCRITPKNAPEWLRVNAA